MNAKKTLFVLLAFAPSLMPVIHNGETVSATAPNPSAPPTPDSKCVKEKVTPKTWADSFENFKYDAKYFLCSCKKDALTKLNNARNTTGERLLNVANNSGNTSKIAAGVGLGVGLVAALLQPKKEKTDSIVRTVKPTNDGGSETVETKVKVKVPFLKRLFNVKTAVCAVAAGLVVYKFDACQKVVRDGLRLAGNTIKTASDAAKK